MKLIIDVPEKVYKNAREDMLFGSGLIANAIKNGTPMEQESCDDAVSRQDLREPRFIIAENDYQKGWNDALESVYENAPSIQPQPKVGQWEWNQYDANPKIGNFHCSLCHSIGRAYFDFCPYCGAKMQEVQDEIGD